LFIIAQIVLKLDAVSIGVVGDSAISWHIHVSGEE
jgi:hypothetical protein